LQATLRLRSWRLWVSLRRVADMDGICSALGDDRHILMWDFDDTPISQVNTALRLVQITYDLPTIYVLESNAAGSYLAYCFPSKPWREAVKIVIDTQGVDWNFVRLSMIRGYFTLRISAKRGVLPKIMGHLNSPVKPEATVSDLQKAHHYETSKKR